LNLESVFALFCFDIASCIPISTLFCSDLVAEHASDATSAAVRVGAIQAFTAILEAPQSHAVLRELLPSAGNLIHDKVEKVRVAVVKMLHHIKKIPTIKYYHIVPVEHLNARFVEESKTNPTNAVANSLTGLMVNSYFPRGPTDTSASSVELMQRTLKFISDDPDSAAVFYANVANYRPLDSIVQLIVNLFKCLYSSIEEEQHKKNRRKSDVGKRRRFDIQEDDEKGNDNSIPISTQASLAETVQILWKSIQVDLEGYEEWHQFLIDEFSRSSLPTVLGFFEEKASIAKQCTDEEEAEAILEDCNKATSAILSCAELLPSKSIEGLVTYIASVLASEDLVVDDSGSELPITSHIALLCVWNMTDDIADVVASSIQSGFRDGLSVGSPDAKSKKRRGGRRSLKRDDNRILPHFSAQSALNILGAILRGSEPGSVTVREAILSSQKARNAIEKTLEEGFRLADDGLNGISVSCRAWRPPQANIIHSQ
jgi:hypothetical protein